MRIRGVDPDSQPIDAWDALQRGQTLGKRIVIPFTPSSSSFVIAKSSVNIFSIQANNDTYSQQLCVTLSPPKMIVDPAIIALIASGDYLNASGEMDNATILNLPDSMQPIIADSYATIDWGIGGVSDEVDADFSNGLCVNLCSSFVRVSATVQDPTQQCSQALYVLSGFIGPGNPKSNNAQRTIKTTSNLYPNVGYYLNEGEISNFYATPKYAKAVTLIGIQANTADPFNPGSNNPFEGSIQFFNGAGTLATPSIMVAEFNFTEGIHYPIIVPGTGLFFRVKNLTPTAPAANALTRISAVFDLAV